MSLPLLVNLPVNLLKSSSPWLTIPLLILVSLAIYQYPTRHPHGPPLIRGLPIVGVVPFLRDVHAYFLDQLRRHEGGIFTIVAWTYKVHVVMNPSAVLGVLNVESSLSFREVERWIDEWFFAYPLSMTQNDDLQFRAFEGSAKAHLVTKDGVRELNERYLFHLDALLNQEWESMEDSEATGKVVDLFEWTRRLVFLASTRALYGRDFPAESVMDLYWSFESSLGTLLFLPSITTHSQRRIRAELTTLIASYLAANDGFFPDCSSLIAQRVALGREFNFSSLDMAHTNIDILFALQANATPMSFWVLAHLLPHQSTLHDLLQTKQDLDNSGISHEAIVELVKSDAWLDTHFQESLRMHAHASLMRKCIKETRVGGYTILPGEFLVVPVATYQYSPSIWINPNEYINERFEDWESGQHRTPMARTLKKSQCCVSFGGGVHHCPGRHFAKLEIMALSLLATNIFQFQPIDDVPSGWDRLRYGSGTQQPISPMKVTIKRRQAVL